MSVLPLSLARVGCVCAAVLLNLFVWTSSVLASWEVVHPTSPKNLIYDACWGGGRFVAVGELGAIKTSPDGLNWTLQKAITQNDLLSVAFTGTRFVAAGEGGTILSSADGIDWSFTSPSTTAGFTRVKVMNGALFALGSIGDYGVIYRSTDEGNRWECVADEADGLYGFSDLVYFGGDYIAMDRFSSNDAWRSKDLQTWTNDPSWNPLIGSVTWADVIDGKLVVANGGVAHSVDGINWTKNSGGPWIGKVVAFGGAYYGVKKSSVGFTSGIYRSTDLVSWILLSAIGTDVLCSGGGRLLAIEKTEALGDEANVSSDGEVWERYQNWKRSAPIFAGGAFRSAVGNFLYSSIDSRAWTSSRLPTGFNADSIYYSNGKYFVSGGTKLIVSTDAVNWTAGSYRVDHAPVFTLGKWFAGRSQSLDGLTWTSSGTTVRGKEIAAGNGVLVSVAGASNVFEWWTSSDGTTWTRRTISQAGGDSIAFGNGVFVCVGRMTEAIRTSTNGVSWTTRSLPLDSQWYEKVRFVNGRFVASGDGGTIGWSLDGITWHAANYPVWGKMNPPAYGNSTWLTTGEYVSLSSTDLANWTQLTDYSAIRFTKVRHLNGEFWALDRTHDNIITGSVWRSTDGRVWKPVHRFNFEPTDIAFGNGTYVVTSYYEKAAYSTNGGVTWTDVTVSSSLQAAIAFGMGRFMIAGYGMIYHSPDGISWSSLSIGDGPDFSEIAATSLGLFAVGRDSSEQPNIYRSTDGTTWSPVSSVGGNTSAHYYNTITETGSGVYVGGAYGVLIKSTDGSAWTTVLPGGANFLTDFRSAAVTAEGFVKLDADGALTYTRDLVGFTDFRAIPLGTSRLTSIAVGDGILLGVGDHGTIVRCAGLPDFAPPQSLSFVEAGDRFLDFSWMAAPGTQPAGIEVRYRAVGEQQWITAKFILGGPGVTLRLVGLEPGTTYELSVRAIYPGGASEYFNIPTAAPETLAPIEYWRKQEFGITSGVGDAADSADPDFDGKPNLLEYALGCNPKIPDGFDAVHAKWNQSGASTSGFFTFPCDAFRSDIDWEVWRSYDGLSSWVRVARCAKGARCVSSGAWGVNDPYQQNSSPAGYQRKVVVEVRTGSRAAFLRLGVVPNP